MSLLAGHAPASSTNTGTNGGDDDGFRAVCVVAGKRRALHLFAFAGPSLEIPRNTFFGSSCSYGPGS